jgi:hypothetical protein
LVRTEEEQFLIDSDGKILFTTHFELESFGDYFIVDAQDSLAIVDETGKVILPFGTYELGNFNSNGLTAFLVNDKIGYLNNEMEIELPAKYDAFPNWKMFANFNKAHAKAYNAKTRKFGLINEKGEWVISAKYNDISFFSDIISVLNKKWEFIDLAEKKINFGSFDMAESFFNETALIYDARSNDWNILSKTGELLLDSNMQRINRIDENLIRWQDKQGNLWLGNERGELIFEKPSTRIDKVDDNILRLIGNDEVCYYLIKEKRLIKLAE